MSHIDLYAFTFPAEVEGNALAYGPVVDITEDTTKGLKCV